MKKALLLFLLMLTLLLACTVDSFLFNEKKISRYTLPGNTIPETHIHQVTFNSEGNTLYGYWVESNGSRPGLSILYCHGNKHNIDNYWDRVLFLYELGVNIFIFDYRGFGLSEGSSTEQSLYRDGDAALHYVLEEMKIPADSLCLYGYSLGNVVSIYLASDKVDPMVLIAEAPFASANSLTQSGVGLDLPVGWLTKGDFNNADKIKHINTPLLVLHGTDDDFVRYRDNGRVVFQNAPQPKTLHLIEGANHTNIPQIMGFAKYRQVLQEWFDNRLDK